MDVSSILSVVGWFVQVTFDKYLSSKLESWACSSGLHHHIRSLKLQLLTVRTLLDNLHGRHLENEGLLMLLVELKDATYDAEDLLDELEYFRLQEAAEGRPLASDQTSSSSSSPLQNVFNAANHTSEFLAYRVNRAFDVFATPRKSLDRNEISFRLKEIIENLTRVCASVKDVLSLENLVVAAKQTSIMSHSWQTSSFLTVPKVFGRDKERDHIIDLLTESTISSQYGVPVLPIVGNGGVGKTTLAQLVYNHPRIVRHFDLRIWVCVSPIFDEVSLTREMLEHACNDRHEAIKNLNRLQELLQAELLSKRFLLVLDDVWDDSDKRRWEIVFAPLTNLPRKGNTILMTTRMGSVARMIGTIDSVNIDGLQDEDFWPFFQACVFGSENENRYPKLQKTGKEIASKLYGHPLAARTVGELLKLNLDEGHWTRVLTSEAWKQQKGQFGVMQVLSLSYQFLPGHLQRCFAVCSLFPKGYHFNEDKLINIWMSLGFLPPQDDARRLEDIGKDYLDDLSRRSFFKVLNYNSLRHYVMSDVLHDLAQCVSVDECYIIDGFKSKKVTPTVRHLSIITNYAYNLNDIEQISYNEELVSNVVKLNSMQDTKNLRTLMVIGGCDSHVGQTFLNSLLLKSSNIRLLDLSHAFFPLDKLLCNIENFIHLRYLGLHGSNISALPESLCKVFHLQVLDISGCYQITALPNGMNNLINIRHIITDTDLPSSIAGIGKLTCLQHLKNFYVKKQNGYDIGQLKDMKELGGQLTIRNLENVENEKEACNARLKDKKHLLKLSLNWDDRATIMTHSSSEVAAEVLDALQPHSSLKYLDIRSYMGFRSPKWLIENQHINNLQSVCLARCLNWESLPPLKQLPFLKILHMIDMNAVKSVESEIFPCTLEELRFERIVEWHEWSGTKDGQPYPRLRELVILECPKLSVLPPAKWSGVEASPLFPCLSKLEVKDCPRLMGLCPLSVITALTNISIERAGSISVMKLCSSSHLPPSNLELVIENCAEIKSLNDGLLQGEHVRNLARMTIIGCKDLVFLPTEGFLTALKEVTIRDCPKLSGMPPVVPGLTELTMQKERLLGYVEDKQVSLIENCPSLPSLGEGLLQHHDLRALKSLCIIGFEELVSLPTVELQGLIALQELVIQDCLKLTGIGPLPPRLIDLRLQRVGFTVLPVLSRSSDGRAALTNMNIFISPTVSSLFVLTIAFCPELTSLQEGLFQQSQHLRSLGQLAIIHCENIVYLPPEGFGNLSSLRLLAINSCPKLMLAMLERQVDKDLLPQSLEQLEIGYFSAAYRSLTKLLSNLTSLYFLKISSILQMSKLVLHPLAALQHLIIEDCEELIDLEGLQYLVTLEEVQLEGCSRIKLLKLCHLRALQYLNIKHCDELAAMEGILSLSNLKSLHIEGCPQVTAASYLRSTELQTYPEGFPLLETLYIESTSLLTVQLLKTLTSLQVLEINGQSGRHSQVSFFTEEQEQEFRHLTALKKLYLFDCPSLQSLPENVNNLSSLQELYLKGCIGIQSLPEGGLPISLKELWILDCSEELRIRCLADGYDWHKISHIQKIRLN